MSNMLRQKGLGHYTKWYWQYSPRARSARRKRVTSTIEEWRKKLWGMMFAPSRLIRANTLSSLNFVCIPFMERGVSGWMMRTPKKYKSNMKPAMHVQSKLALHLSWKKLAKSIVIFLRWGGKRTRASGLTMRVAVTRLKMKRRIRDFLL